MAIKVGGTTVIDDTRNITNAGNVTVTGTITGATTISATNFTGSGAGLTGISTVGKSIAMAIVFGG
jgi:hypothetical protein